MPVLRPGLLRLFLLALVGLSLPVRAGQDADAQLWSEGRFVYPVTQELDAFAAGNFRLGDNFSQFLRAGGRLGVNWSPRPNISITPSYLYTVGDPGTSQAQPENRLCLYTAYAVPLDAFRLVLGNTTEYRMIEGAPNFFRLRPKIRLQRPVGPKAWGFDAYIADELFLDCRDYDWTRNRAFAGFEKKINETFSIDLYYCRQTSLIGGRDANAIGFDVSVLLGKPPVPEIQPYLH
jgi:hypothetical protein